MSQDRRRQFLLISGALLMSRLVQAQQQKLWRIGLLFAATASSWAGRMDVLRAGLRDLGYVEGKNILIEARWADGKTDRLPELAAELVRLNVDVLVTGGTPATIALKQATSTIPIVMVVSGDAIATGIVASLARPGGNITGSTFFSPELTAKCVELIKILFPRAKRVAVLLNSENPLSAITFKAAESASTSLKFELHPFKIKDSSEISAVMHEMKKAHIEAVVVSEDAMMIQNAKTIADLALKQRLPVIGFGDLTQAGGLLSYGVDLLSFYRRAAAFVDKILKGAKPADIPVEQSAKFEMIINMRTAKALGVTIPKELLFRADKVIE